MGRKIKLFYLQNENKAKQGEKRLEEFVQSHHIFFFKKTKIFFFLFWLIFAAFACHMSDNAKSGKKVKKPFFNIKRVIKWVSHFVAV